MLFSFPAGVKDDALARPRQQPHHLQPSRLPGPSEGDAVDAEPRVQPIAD